MNTLVVGAAPSPDTTGFYAALLAEARHVVAADAAAEWCIALGRTPDLAIGDFDSAAEGARERLRAAHVEVQSHPRDKDDTDLDLAAHAALDRFGPPLVLTACSTARTDHTLAAFGTLMRAGARASLREPGWQAWVCAPGAPLDFTLGRDTTVSLLAPLGASGVTIRGVRWPLDDALLEPLSGHAVSNRALGGPVAVSTACHPVFVIVGEPER